MDTTKQWILSKSKDLFMRYGLKSVTMDDLARQLGISKKTLYQYIQNKADLVAQVIALQTEEEVTAIADIQAKAQNALEEMLNIAKYVVQMLRSVSPTAMYDLQKYYRKSWKEVEDLHRKYIYEVIKNNLEKGIQQGIYRKELNVDIVAKFYVGKSLLVVDEDFFPLKEYGKDILFKEFFQYHIHGIASPKGLELLEQYLK